MKTKSVLKNLLPKFAYNFLIVGKTAESSEGTDFKRYVGVASSKVIGFNPDKDKLDELLGYASQNAPVYTGTDETGFFARLTFIVATDPEASNDIDLKTRLSFTLRPTAAYNRDKTKVQVIDEYGNTAWMLADDAKEGKKPLSSNGNPLRVADKYRMACVGEADLVAFLKAYLNVGDAFEYVNGTWVLKDNAGDYEFSLEHVKDYFKGDFSEIRQALELQPNNKVKLLYGVRTDSNGHQYQTVATRAEFILRNNAGSRAYEKLEKDLASAKQNGAFPTTEFKVQELQEWVPEADNLSQPVGASADADSVKMPWD